MCMKNQVGECSVFYLLYEAVLNHGHVIGSLIGRGDGVREHQSWVFGKIASLISLTLKYK